MIELIVRVINFITELEPNFPKARVIAGNEKIMSIAKLTGWSFFKTIAQRSFFTFALFFPMQVFAQIHDPFGSEKFQFDRLEQVRGIENSTVTSIVQDDYGFMWFGTLAGLVRFDGHEIRRYENDLTNDNSLASNYIRGLAKDKKGNLWIATQGGGLDKFEIATERFSHYRHDPADSFSISGNSIASVFVDSRGLIWAGTYSKGVNVLDPLANKFRRIKEQKYFYVRAITEDHSGMIWFSSNGINRVDPTNFNLEAFHSGPGDPPPLATGGIRSIYHDKNGKIWVATHDQGGVFNFEEKSGKFKRFDSHSSPVSVFTFCEDKSGRLWTATSRGIAVINNDQINYYQPNRADNASLSRKVVFALYCDREGTVWIGCEGGGVNKLHTGKKFLTFRYSDPEGLFTHNTLRSLFEDKDGRIWIGWTVGGIDILDPRSNSLTKFDSKEFDNVTCFYQDTDNSYWIGTWGSGLFHYSPSLKKIAQYINHNTDNSIPDDRLQGVLRDRDGILWVGTENGLSQFDEKKNVWKPVKKPYFPFELLGSNVQTLAMVEAPDGTIWAGTWLGLNAISPDRKTIKHFSPGNELNASSGYHVISLCLDQASNVLWVGTFESGLNRLNLLTGEITRVTREQGLPSNTIFGIQRDDRGNLWLSTSNGLSKYNPETGTCRNYDAADGLQGDEFLWGASLKTRDGKMFFGGVSGLNMFTPSEIVDNTNIPTVVVSEFEIFNKPVTIGGADSLLQKWLPETKEIRLTYEQSVFTFGFAALDYTRPEKNQYAYILEGFDKDWNYVGNKSSATYTNIDQGEYTFRVKASNNDGVWNEAVNSITVIITPPFWRTWWFRTISVVFVIGCLLTFYFVRIGIANRQRSALEYKVNLRTREITAKNHEILLQMEKVKHLSEEIAQQRDNIEQQNNLLASAKTELEKKVKERTNELSLSNKELMRQNVQLEQFTFMTAHNLRSPVARLLGLTSIFNRQNLTDPLNIEVINRVQKSALDLDEVIKDIADILQVQKGTKHHLEPLLVYPVIQRALQVLSPEINEHNMNVVNKINPGIAIYGIPAYVHSVFYNIISNAVKYADLRKRPHIEIESVQNNGHVNITFADNGIGFDRENLKDKLFKPFSRLNSNGDGKGLGLYLVKIEMESMNGEVNIESRVDSGTLVTLKFLGHA